MPASVNEFHPKSLWKDAEFFSKIFYANKFDLSEGWEVFTLLREFLPYQIPAFRTTGTKHWWKNLHTFIDYAALQRLHYVKSLCRHVQGWDTVCWDFPRNVLFCLSHQFQWVDFSLFFLFWQLLHFFKHTGPYIPQAGTQANIKISYFWDTVDLLLKLCIIIAHLQWYIYKSDSGKHWRT